ncbi:MULTISPECIES: hypothetical protein [Carboxydocella]|uniref:Uncharacterized protein n=2 Tax=Carboxydocella TaxID=178898 RepID=A0A1T4S1U5_9FIRM|nr:MULTISPECIES: hypothetical protein [Carboxydocella]AVX20678.1 hypothetical protein CFE_1489 [Carboxydocella thermautotrophica]AVX31098.1 hypothetical protein CTH_1508 [Carboxydocella thermautotrophica]SKA22280.1 hypothetical protein SAMN02745885_02393 [Carboxydocella sporoproducens DSM 16521]GAW28209.1 hypothetical protein ULO1_07790 [Carboxydocella sp. ULO1]GAW32816.1 hypothetical protein JDF658_25810 [Carboxydocella sp. JDF658]
MNKNKKETLIICPICQSRDIGILRQNLWFCRACFCELVEKSGKIVAFGIEQDGSLKKIEKSA